MQHPPGYPPQQPPGYPPQQPPGYPPQQPPGYPPQQPGPFPGHPQPPQKKRTSPVVVVLLVLGVLGALGIGGCIVCVALLPDVEPSASGGATPEKASLDDYLGTWTAKGIVFSMNRGKGLDGEEVISVQYKKDASVVGVGTSVEKTGRFKELDGDDVVVGVAFLNTTIEVDVPPHEDGGVWKMTVEGDELIRQSAPGPSPAPSASAGSSGSASSSASPPDPASSK